MFYVYVLKSTKNGDIYIGYSKDLKKRFQAHNVGKVRSTKACSPWVLLYYEAYKSKEDATIREKRLKEHSEKDLLRSHLKYSLQ